MTALLLACWLAAPTDPWPPEAVSVLPVVFQPSDSPEEPVEAAYLAALRAVRARYAELLGGPTFRLAEVPRHVTGRWSVGEYARRPDGGLGAVAGELLEATGDDRFTCPHVFAVLLLGRRGPTAGEGRPLNGGLGRGGGLALLSSADLASPGFGDLLAHELGHAFGLVHPDAYGHDMTTHPALMAYRRGGELSGEDRRGLARCRAIAPSLPEDHDPTPLAWLEPLPIPGQPGWLPVVSADAELDGSLDALIAGWIAPADAAFEASRMVRSKPLEAGWMTLTLRFPVPLRLDRIRLESGAAGEDRATQMTVWAGGAELAGGRVAAPSVELSFAPTTSAEWRVRLRAGASRRVVVRGVRLFDGDRERYAPLGGG